MNQISDFLLAPSNRWRSGILLFLVVLFLAIPQAALWPLLDRDEPRFAEASREMLQSGNFIVPTFNHEPRYAKPPLIYWAEAACYSVLGENAFAARLPSLLATAGTALLLLAWGTALGGATTGMIAGLGYAFCFQVIQQGRVATADALMIFFVTFTAFAGWKLLTVVKTGHGSWNIWGTWLALGFAGGFLAKGPEALLPLLPLVWMMRRFGWPVLATLGAIFLLGLFIVAWWAVPAFIQTHGDYWKEGLGHDVGDRMVSGFQGHGASTFGWYLLGLPFYFLIFWVSALPWSPLIVLQYRRLFTGWKRDETDVYLLLNAALFFGIFSLMVTKLPHYTLPAFPFLALLFARRWQSAGLAPQRPLRLMIWTGLIVAILVVLLLLLRPTIDPSPTGRLVEKAGNLLTPKTSFAVVDFQEPNTIWEMRRVSHAYGEVLPKTGEALGSYLRQPGPRAVLLTSGAWQAMRAGVNPDPTWQIFSAQGWNAAKGSFLDLTLIVKK